MKRPYGRFPRRGGSGKLAAMRFKYTLTPATQRAMAAAAGWTSQPACDRLDLPEMLLGLLDEPECRGALLLAARGVSAQAVLQRWPGLTRRPPAEDSPQPSADLAAALRAAREQLADLPRPLELATEHVLLGILSTSSEAASWLLERGFDPEALDDEVHVLAGCERNAAVLDLPRDEPPAAGDPRPLDNDRPASVGEATALARIVDAAANRAAEGLRVVEDYVRFVLDDAHLTSQLKRLRHELAEALRTSCEKIGTGTSRSIPHNEAAYSSLGASPIFSQPSVFAPRDRLASRESQADVGADIKLPSEVRRADAADVVAASWQRVVQSLRSLEEYGKLIDPAAAAAIEHLRYRAYTLEKAVGITAAASERLQSARLYVLVDGGESAAALASLVAALVAAGVDMIQLRDKRLDDRTLAERAKTVRRLTQGTSTLFVVNDRPDIAVVAGADGVHVGQEELSVRDVRKVVGPRALVGLSTHSLEQARAAVLAGADYIGVGPTFPSPTKEFPLFPGLDLVRAVASEIRLPAYAIGGIALDNVSQVVAAGLRRVAVGAAITQAPDPAEAARRMREMLGT